mmetsp:Transcript_28288/g.52192  ORF Transcript_28288/g.52192 Transcript_28288/m.52192 type:complete len:204 (+) Transcript_28288:456-1067(+)
MATLSLLGEAHHIGAESTRNLAAVLRQTKLEEMTNNIAAKGVVTQIFSSRIQDLIEKISSGTFSQRTVLKNPADNAAAETVARQNGTRPKQFLNNETGARNRQRLQDLLDYIVCKLRLHSTPDVSAHAQRQSCCIRCRGLLNGSLRRAAGHLGPESHILNTCNGSLSRIASSPELCQNLVCMLVGLSYISLCFLVVYILSINY